MEQDRERLPLEYVTQKAALARTPNPPAPPRRMPRDTQLVGSLCIAFGLALFLSGLAILTGIARLPDWTYTLLTLFGTVQLTSAFWQGINLLLHGCGFGLGGYGLTKGQAYGWWVVLLVLFNGIPTCIVNIDGWGYKAFVWLGLVLVLLAWLLARARWYHPLGRKPRRADAE